MTLYPPPLGKCTANRRGPDPRLREIDNISGLSRDHVGDDLERERLVSCHLTLHFLVVSEVKFFLLLMPFEFTFHLLCARLLRNRFSTREGPQGPQQQRTTYIWYSCMCDSHVRRRSATIREGKRSCVSPNNITNP